MPCPQSKYSNKLRLAAAEDMIRRRSAPDENWRHPLERARTLATRPERMGFQLLLADVFPRSHQHGNMGAEAFGMHHANLPAKE